MEVVKPKVWTQDQVVTRVEECKKPASRKGMFVEGGRGRKGSSREMRGTAKYQVGMEMKCDL
jgi:hypothetical protein